MKRDRLFWSRYIQIGLKIGYYRRLGGYTQDELAEMVDLSAGYFGHIEAANMVTPISLETLFKIADALNVPPYKFLEFDDAPYEKEPRA